MSVMYDSFDCKVMVFCVFDDTNNWRRKKRWTMLKCERGALKIKEHVVSVHCRYIILFIFILNRIVLL